MQAWFFERNAAGATHRLDDRVHEMQCLPRIGEIVRFDYNRSEGDIEIDNGRRWRIVGVEHIFANAKNIVAFLIVERLFG